MGEILGIESYIWSSQLTRKEFILLFDCNPLSISFVFLLLLGILKSFYKSFTREITLTLYLCLPLQNYLDWVKFLGLRAIFEALKWLKNNWSFYLMKIKVFRNPGIIWQGISPPTLLWRSKLPFASQCSVKLTLMLSW